VSKAYEHFSFIKKGKKGGGKEAGAKVSAPIKGTARGGGGREQPGRSVVPDHPPLI